MFRFFFLLTLLGILSSTNFLLLGSLFGSFVSFDQATLLEDFGHFSQVIADIYLAGPLLNTIS